MSARFVKFGKSQFHVCRQRTQYDTQAETFRVAAAEYLLLVTRVSSVMRKDKVWPGEWERLWYVFVNGLHEFFSLMLFFTGSFLLVLQFRRTIESTMVELQKKTTSHPNRQLVEEWGRQVNHVEVWS